MRAYLTGPITGKSSAEIVDWRKFLREQCQDIEFVDPTLADVNAEDSYVKHETASEALQRLNYGRLVIDRNRTLIKSCDLVLANFLTAANRASIGSVGELFLANAFGKPVIIVRQQFGNIHDHAMLNAIASRVCFSLEAGCETLISFAWEHLHIA